METKNLVIFGAGVLTGYLLTQYFMGNVQTTTTETPQVSENMPDYNAICSAKLNERLMTSKFGSETDMEAFKTQFMSDCLASNANI